MNLLKHLKGALYPLGLLLVEAVIFVSNFKPGTYLIGWDNIMPELNLNLNFTRSFTSVWQGYRGLGTLDGMGHAANLIHTIYIAILSLFLNQNLLRYTYIYGTHLAGGLAFYYLAIKLLKNKNAAFLGALFYMLNLGVIQMYFAPLEVFATHFAALPVMGLAIYNAIYSKTKFSLFLLAISCILTSQQGFVPTVFFAYLIFAFFILLFAWGKTVFKRIALIAAIIFITNAFWILPFSYSAIFKANEIKNTRINEFSSDEIYYRNKARGSFLDVIKLQGFMLDTIEYDTNAHKNVYFMSAWLNQAKRIPIVVINYFFVVMALLGIFVTLKYKVKTLYPFLATFGISFFFLANNTPVLSGINDILRGIFPLFGEAFRFPFTKFITVFAFCYALFISLGASFFIKILINTTATLLGKIPQVSGYVINLTLKASYIFLMAIAVTAILYNSSPVFRGNFTSPLLRLKIPNEYFETISYFKTQDPNARILSLPLDTFWNWQFRDWGHRGSGFMWYGIAQPMVERQFDPWSKYNEQLYNELSYAEETNNIESFDRYLTKYDISYIFLDETILNTLSAKPIDYNKIEEFLGTSKILLPQKKFGKLLIYKVKNNTSFVYSLPKLPTVNSTFTQGSNDAIYQNLSNYQNSSNNSDFVYPFSSLSTLKLEKDTDFTFIKTANSLIFKSALKPIKNGKYELSLPSLFDKEFLIPVKATVANNSVYLTPLYPEIKINGKDITPHPDPIIINPQSVHNPAKITFLDINHTIDLGSKSDSYLINNLVNTIRLSDGVNEENVEVDTTQMPKTIKTVELNAGINTIEIIIPLFDSPFAANDVISGKHYKIVKNSDTGKMLKNAKSNSKIDSNGVTLTAQNTSISVDYYMADVFHQASYAVIADTSHLKGLPVNFYVDSPLEEKSVLETKFDQNRKKSLAILPPTDQYIKGYGFHFIAKSVGNETAQNQIREINIYPIPMATINNMVLLNSNYVAPVTSDMGKTNMPFKTIGTFVYKTTLPQNASLIALSQSYDPAWHAYVITNSSSKLKNFFNNAFPFIFGKKLNHTKINSWENTWQIPNSGTSNQPALPNINLDGKSIIMFYLPQYLEFAGIGILITPLLFLLLPLIKQINSFFEAKAQKIHARIEDRKNQD